MSQSPKELSQPTSYLKKSAEKILELSGYRRLTEEEINKEISYAQRYWIGGAARNQPLEKKDAIAMIVNNGERTLISAVAIGYPGFEKDLLTGLRLCIDNINSNIKVKPDIDPDALQTRLTELKAIRDNLPTQVFPANPPLAE